jgi:NAD(P)-dependent dehydrogenase (short-subunit alcohol dehydrogenase family)
MYPELQNKVVVVTGAGAGIGRAIASRFGREGSIVIVNDLRAETAQKVADEIKSVGGQALAIPGDMTKPADVDRMFDQVIEKHGRIDVLVNNVGLFEYAGPIVGTSPEYWERLYRINVTSTFLCASRAAQHMKEAGRGRIINISSAAGKIGSTGTSGYGSTKWAVLGLTKSLANELAPGILVNAVCPGFVDTAMNETWLVKAMAKEGSTNRDAFEAKLYGGIPLKRVAKPEDIAKAVAFLASDEASYTTGEGFNVSGGLVMH